MNLGLPERAEVAVRSRWLMRALSPVSAWRGTKRGRILAGFSLRTGSLSVGCAL